MKSSRGLEELDARELLQALSDTKVRSEERIFQLKSELAKLKQQLNNSNTNSSTYNNRFINVNPIRYRGEEVDVDKFGKDLDQEGEDGETEMKMEHNDDENVQDMSESIDEAVASTWMIGNEEFNKGNFSACIQHHTHAAKMLLDSLNAEKVKVKHLSVMVEEANANLSRASKKLLSFEAEKSLTKEQQARCQTLEADLQKAKQFEQAYLASKEEVERKEAEICRLSKSLVSTKSQLEASLLEFESIGVKVEFMNDYKSKANENESLRTDKAFLQMEKEKLLEDKKNALKKVENFTRLIEDLSKENSQLKMFKIEVKDLKQAMHKLKEEVNTLNKANLELKGKLEDSNLNMHSMELRFDAENRTMRQKEKQLIDQLHEANKKIDMYEKELQDLFEIVQNVKLLEEKVRNMQVERDDMDKNLVIALEENSTLMKQMDVQTVRNNDLERQLAEALNILQTFDNVKKTLDDKKCENAVLKKKMSEFEAEIKSYAAKLNIKEDSELKTIQMVEQLKFELIQKEQLLAQTTESVSDLDLKNEALKVKLEELEKAHMESLNVTALLEVESKKNIELISEKSAVENDLLDQKAKILEKEEQIQHLAQILKEKDESEKELIFDVEDLKKKVLEKEQETADLVKEFSHVKENVQEICADFNLYEQKMLEKKKTQESDITTKLSAYDSLTSDLKNKEAIIKTLNVEVKFKKNEIAELRDNFQMLQLSLDALKVKCEDLRKESAEHVKEKADAAARLKIKNDECEQMKTQMQELSGALTRVTDRLHELEGQVASQKATIKRHETDREKIMVDAAKFYGLDLAQFETPIKAESESALKMTDMSALEVELNRCLMITNTFHEHVDRFTKNKSVVEQLVFENQTIKRQVQSLQRTAAVQAEFMDRLFKASCDADLSDQNVVDRNHDDHDSETDVCSEILEELENEDFDVHDAELNKHDRFQRNQVFEEDMKVANEKIDSLQKEVHTLQNELMKQTSKAKRFQAKYEIKCFQLNKLRLDAQHGSKATNPDILSVRGSLAVTKDVNSNELDDLQRTFDTSRGSDVDLAQTSPQEIGDSEEYELMLKEEKIIELRDLLARHKMDSEVLIRQLSAIVYKPGMKLRVGNKEQPRSRTVEFLKAVKDITPSAVVALASFLAALSANDYVRNAVSR